jgi:hypothetical protein
MLQFQKTRSEWSVYVYGGPQVKHTIFEPCMHQSIVTVDIQFCLASDVHCASLGPFSYPIFLIFHSVVKHETDP